MDTKKSRDNIFFKSLAFIRENASITYSLLLLVLIPVGFLVNDYLINADYERAINAITWNNAILAENVINNLVQDKTNDAGAMQAVLDRIKMENESILALSILEPAEKRGSFRVAASTNQGAIGQVKGDDGQSNLVWTTGTPFSQLGQSGSQRYWTVTRKLFDSSNQEVGLIEASFSLSEADEKVNSAFSASIWVLVITLLVAVLFIANQARLIYFAMDVPKLREIDRMKDMFISMASHELRTPLTAMKWYVDALKEKKALASDKESAQYINNLAETARRLDNLVEDILEVSRIEGNRLPMELKVVDANEIIARSVEMMRPQASNKHLDVRYKSAEAPLYVKADPDRLKQVMINLIGNAVKYTEKGSIDVSTTSKKDELSIIVADTGIGISSEDQAKLFKKFSRVVNDHTRDITGTGLGLWITSEIAKRMQGRITVESIEGVGSHFTVHIPLAKK